MRCEERSMLIRTYKNEVHAHAAIVMMLQHCGRQSERAFERYWNAADAAREKCQLAMLSLDQHSAFHGCGVGERLFVRGRAA